MKTGAGNHQLGASAGRAGEAEADAALLRAMGAGDERALATLYDRWWETVRGLVLCIVRDADEADDVVEETFWQAWRQAARYDASRGSVGAWLVMMARSRALDWVRSRRGTREDAAPVKPEMLPATGAESDPAGGAEASERTTLVAAAMRELPPEQQEVMRLAYFEGLSQSEIVERTGQPLGTIKTRVRLAMRKLKERLSTLREVPT